MINFGSVLMSIDRKDAILKMGQFYDPSKSCSYYPLTCWYFRLINNYMLWFLLIQSFIYSLYYFFILSYKLIFICSLSKCIIKYFKKFLFFYILMVNKQLNLHTRFYSIQHVLATCLLHRRLFNWELFPKFPWNLSLTF